MGGAPDVALTEGAARSQPSPVSDAKMSNQAAPRSQRVAVTTAPNG